ncbi:hypothetical protein MUK42_36092 [Musa troglodytarum]|uniref:Uncharacterized protein n=1 Tax=Musa troglodytarum TaxID=320322 RepID=A0A9E7HI92_9LILI|nr:hypothetical protein MUK42_36092 [Musa troglodytarum]
MPPGVGPKFHGHALSISWTLLLVRRDATHMVTPPEPMLEMVGNSLDGSPPATRPGVSGDSISHVAETWHAPETATFEHREWARAWDARL